jgi:hypothetical protein
VSFSILLGNRDSLLRLVHVGHRLRIWHALVKATSHKRYNDGHEDNDEDEATEDDCSGDQPPGFGVLRVRHLRKLRSRRRIRCTHLGRHDGYRWGAIARRMLTYTVYMSVVVLAARQAQQQHSSESLAAWRSRARGGSLKGPCRRPILREIQCYEVGTSWKETK